MAIEFVVEDGTGLSNSTSYVSVADFQQYWNNNGVDYTASPVTAVLQAWLNEATQFVDNSYTFCGDPIEEDQALQLPQSDLYYKKVNPTTGNCYPVDGIPKEIKIAVYEIAHARQANPTANTIDSNVSEKSIGPVRVKYNSSITSEAIKYTYSVANKQLSKICQITGRYVERI